MSKKRGKGDIPKFFHRPIGFLVAAFLAFTALSSISSAMQSKSWPVAEGIVKSNDIERVRKHKYRPVVRYEYLVNETQYRSKRVRFGAPFPRKRFGEYPLQKKYPKDSGVAVHYDPANPYRATLETKLPSFASFLMLFLGTFGMWLSAHPKSLAAVAKKTCKKMRAD